MLGLSLLPSAALAHEASGGFVLLLPTGFYTLGAALAVLASLILLAVVPQAGFHRLYTGSVKLFRWPFPDLGLLSLLSTLLVFALIAAGLFGLDDPLRNPLPLVLWTLGWIVMTLASAVFGNIWNALNPWTGFVRLLGWGERPYLRLPRRLGHGIAILQFACLIWVDLISIYNMDPEWLVPRLGWFWLVNFLGMVIFGVSDWRDRAEPLSVYFRLVGAIAPLGRDGAGNIRLGLPGAHAVALPPLGASGVIFVLMSLAAGTFDAISTTFQWLGLVGQNPLDFHGRSAVMWPNALGLLAVLALLWIAYQLCVRIGARLAGARGAVSNLLGRLVYSILPISVAFHASHFLPRLIVDAQYLLQVISDPLGRGWNLFGTAQLHTTTSMFARPEVVFVLWNLQVAIITLGHVIGISIAHAIALDRLGHGSAAVRSQLLLGLFMVGYTALGLWLLASPRL